MGVRVFCESFRSLGRQARTLVGKNSPIGKNWEKSIIHTNADKFTISIDK